MQDLSYRSLPSEGSVLKLVYDFKEKIIFQLHAYRLLQGGCRMVFGKDLQRYKSVSCACQEDNDQHKRYGASKKSIWRLWAI